MEIDVRGEKREGIVFFPLFFRPLQAVTTFFNLQLSLAHALNLLTFLSISGINLNINHLYNKDHK